MAYGHAERNLALLRQLEAETRQLLGTLDQPDPEQSAWLQEAGLVRGREEKPRAVRQDQVLLAERPWWHAPGNVPRGGVAAALDQGTGQGVHGRDGTPPDASVGITTRPRVSTPGGSR